MEAIGRRAGRSSKLMTFDDQSDELSSFELAKLKSLVLVSGAPRTMAVHIKSFEKWELWTANNVGELYPINIDKVLKYCISLDQRECGPSVIPAFKISLKWVASRLAIDLPDLDDEEDPTKVPEIPGDDHAEFREQFVGRHPDVLLPPHREPHRKLVERIQRDFLVHGAVPFYQVGEFRTRSEQVIQKSGISKTADDLIKVVAVDQPVQAASEAQVLDRLHCFFVALEYLNICEFTVAAGPLKYLAELEEWRHENRGLALLLTVDTLIRQKVHRLNHDRRKEFSTFSKALLEVLVNHKQIWNDARSSAELDKFKQAGHQDPETPNRSTKRARSPSERDHSPLKASPKQKKNKARRERQKAVLAKAKATIAGSAPKKTPSRDDRIPEKEWKAITGFKYSGKRRCPFFNSSLGCRFADGCRNAHACVECGAAHAWHGNH